MDHIARAVPGSADSELTMNWQLLTTHLGITLAVITTYVTTWFILALIRKRNDVADIAWGLGIATVGVTALVLSGIEHLRLALAALLVLLWGSRLSYHIYKRVRTHAEEDYRYARWRTEWRYVRIRSYLQVFLLQGLLMIVVGYPLVHLSASDSTPLSLLDVVAVAVWLFGFVFETVGDRQLARFIKSGPQPGAVLDSGLWRYTRHPNYFGEVTQWWGIWIFALATPWGWTAVIGPLAITFLIVKVSGVPLLEAKLMQNPAYREYATRTSMLVPLTPAPQHPRDEHSAQAE